MQRARSFYRHAEQPRATNKDEHSEFDAAATEDGGATAAVVRICSPSARGKSRKRSRDASPNTPQLDVESVEDAHRASSSSAGVPTLKTQARSSHGSVQRLEDTTEDDGEAPIGRRSQRPGQCRPESEAAASGSGHAKRRRTQEGRQKERAAQQQQQRAAATAAATMNTPVTADRPDARGQIDVGPQQCVATNKGTNRQCEQQTQHGCHCEIHRAQLDGTRIQASSVPGAGKGLWAATRDFRQGDIVARYTGDLVRTENASASRYVLQLSTAVSIDAARTNTADGRMVNDARGSGQRSNTRYVVDQRNKTASLRATRTIKKGTEVLASYGRQFWSHVDC